MKMPTIVGIFIFISRENFMLSWYFHYGTVCLMFCSVSLTYFSFNSKVGNRVATSLGKVRKTCGDISTTLIQGFNFMNSRFQLHEFTISTSRIHDFNFTNSTSGIQLHEFTNSTSRIHEFNFMNSRIQLHGFTNSTS